MNPRTLKLMRNKIEGKRWGSMREKNLSTIPMRVKIRQFRCEDLKKVLEIDEEFPPTSRELISDKDALKLFRQNPRGCLVAEKEGKVVGFIFSELREGSCIIKFLQVLPECMGESIVAKLMDEAMRTTKAKAVYG